MSNTPAAVDNAVADSRRDLTRTVLAVLLIVLMIAASLWVLRPFLLSIVWAAMIVVATWPLMLKVQARLRRRAMAVTVMSAVMVLVFVVPLLLAIQTIVDNADTIARWARAIDFSKISSPPDWLARIPIVGSSIAERWIAFAALGKEELVTRVTPYAADAAKWTAVAVGGVGFFAIEFFLTVVIAVIMYTKGEAVRDTLVQLGRRLAGDRGRRVVLLAGEAIRAVALGVVVTALVQTILAGVGLFAAGIPFAGFLTGITLLFCIAQIGPTVVLAPAVIWLFWSDSTGWGTALLIWTLLLASIDNILRPLLIRRGAQLPLLLIFAGVIGGLFAFGIVGLFVGPVVLAVSYTLLQEWLADRDRA